ncbi:GGDEF domain-containing protein [Paracidovorax citrulli]|uniref:GGDEF domain-containing protein n=1 Tax=Paracidovorax citrulli TaxID=80869 RepID=UPI0002F047C0|nr:diguanylate cyclase [Paracidovorax citrulli]UEG45767.1 diguanylate cyclase [Paracidovorax citrulli]
MLVVVQAVALLLGVVGAGMLVWTAVKFNAASDWVEHTHEVLDEITAVRTELLRGGLALRDYAISPAPPYLERARAAARGATDASERLEELVQDNPRQSERAIALRAEAAEFVGWMNSTAMIAERDGPAGLLAGLVPRISQDSAKVLRQQLMAMEAEERLLLQARTQERAREYRRLIIGATLGGAAFIIFLVWSVTYAAALFRRSTTRIETLSESADCDPLTGLLNRRALEERFTSLAGSPLTVVAFDLDDFKPVNDTYGHQAGDEVLMVTAKRMLRECRDGDLVARVGGDEFVVVLSGVPDADTARSVCTRLQHVLCEPIQLHTAAVRVGVSLGYEVSPGGIGLSDLLARADAAAYAQKSVRKGKSLRSGER